MPDKAPPTPFTRWLALGAAGGAAVALAIENFGPSGPWQGLALLLVLLTLFAIIVYLQAARRDDEALQQADERARRGESAIGELQREIDRHTQLERELLEAKQAAESAVLAKGEFLATMSHEIRTPLNGIVPMLDLLMHAQLSPDHRELVRAACTSSQHLLRIVDDILDYSKLEADKLELETTTFNLRDLLESVIQLMYRPAESKGLRLHLRIDPSVRLPVRGDPVRLRQVLSNLISNAVKFTERGAITVSVTRLGESVSQHKLRFEVRDTGIGIEPDAQPRLFQAFSQADASTTRLYGGTGLGLAISRRMVELMGGSIGVVSEPGHGSTFHFELPLLKVQGDMPSRELQFDGGRLLLLTSDPRLRTHLSMLLPNWGLRVTAVETTQEALDRLRAASAQGPPWVYDIVLADLAGMRNTALALHRNLERHAVFGNVRLVCLRGDDPVPDELRRNTTLLSRLAPDADLRAVLQSQPAPPAEEATVPLAPRTAPAAAQSPLASARVLLVEDNPVNLMVGQRLLGVLGVECDTAQNGEAALLQMQAARYDLVLMDCQMPVMDGYSATRRWRETEENAQSGHLPIIAMTANAMAGDRQKCIDAGMDDYLPKPVTRVELERCLHRWWRPRAATTPVAPVPALAVDQLPAQGYPAAVGIASAAVPRIAPAAAIRPAPRVPPRPMPAAGERGVIAPEVLDELRDVLGDEVDRLIRVFLDTSPSLISRLEAAAEKPDYEAMREAAHSLKSSSANLGAMALSAAAKRIELGARMQSLDRPAVAIALLEQDYARARDALSAMLAPGVEAAR